MAQVGGAQPHAAQNAPANAQPTGPSPKMLAIGDRRDDLKQNATSSNWAALKNSLPFLGRTTYGQIMHEAKQFDAAVRAGTLTGAAMDTRLEGLKDKISAWEKAHPGVGGPKAQGLADLKAAVKAAMPEALAEKLVDRAKDTLRNIRDNPTTDAAGRRDQAEQLKLLVRDAKEWIKFQGPNADQADVDRISNLATRLEAVAAPRTHAVAVDNKPNAMTIGADGVVSGQATLNTTIPLGSANAVPVGKAFTDAQNAMSTQTKNTATFNIAPPGSQPQNVVVSSQAGSDMYRLDLKIDQPGGTAFKSRDVTSTDQADRNTAATRALHTLAGGDANTTKVLSMMTTQNTVFSFTTMSMPNGNGGNTMLTYPSAFNDIGLGTGAGKFMSEDGPVDVDLSNAGGAKYELSKLPNGDFKVKVQQDAYFNGTTPRAAGDTRLKADVFDFDLGTGGLIGARFEAEFIVNGADAAQGKLNVDIPGGVSVSFMGKIPD